MKLVRLLFVGLAARLFGLGDRGVLQAGKKADINVIDHDRLTLHAPRMAPICQQEGVAS